MDFYWSAFKDQDIHIALYSMADEHSSTDDIQQRKDQLLEIVKTYSQNITVINPKYVRLVLF